MVLMALGRVVFVASASAVFLAQECKKRAAAILPQPSVTQQCLKTYYTT
jgi:hypothetical protein